MMPPTPARILVIGSGAREHALAWKLAAEPGVDEVVVLPGSAAIAAEPGVRCLADLDPLDLPVVVDAARAAGSELVVIGPEAPLAAGIADALGAAGIAVFGPTRAAARIETSKAFCHEVAAAAGVRMARARAFRAGELDAALAFAGELAAGGAGVVVKADGLAAGKGVTVCDDAASAGPHLSAILGPGRSAHDATDADADAEDGRPLVVVEERLVGREASVIALTDGREALALPAARDHKRLGDGDAGPNTGGMGAYSPVPDLPDTAAAALLATIHRPLLAELARRGTPFRGFLYAGLMLTADGPVLLECNARLGDPETQVILPRLKGSLAPALLAAAVGDLGPIVRGLAADGSSGPALPASRVAAVGVVLAAAGYPGTPRRGDRIGGLEAAAAAGGLIFHAGTAAVEDGTYATSGGRVLTVVGLGPDLAGARAIAEHAADAIDWAGVQRRHDIAAVPPDAVPARMGLGPSVRPGPAEPGETLAVATSGAGDRS